MRRPLPVADAASHAALTLWCGESVDSEEMLADRMWRTGEVGRSQS